jgi:tRNA(Ile)-lysidine synthase
MLPMTVVSSIKETLKRFAPNQRFLLGCSGGLDSVALLYALQQIFAAESAQHLRVVHVDHDLQAPSAAWADSVVQHGAALNIPVVVKKVVVAAGNLEAEARRARYLAYREVIEADEVLILAHHQQDQAETVLMRLLSGSGVSGLAAMRELQERDGLQILRPWLGVARSDIHQFAVNHALQWVDDPANDDTHYERVLLRQQVWPLLGQHWPGFEAAMVRTATLMADAESVLVEQGARDLAACLGADGSLDIRHIEVLSVARRRWLLARWMQGGAAYPPPLSRVDAVGEMLTARVDAQPQVDWQSGETTLQFRRYQDRLYRLPQTMPVAELLIQRFKQDQVLTLASGVWQVSMQPQGLPLALLDQPLRLRARQHGEVLHLSGRVGRWPLKKLLQSLGLAPWQREQVYILETLAAEPLALLSAAGLWLVHGVAVEAGWGLARRGI